MVAVTILVAVSLLAVCVALGLLIARFCSAGSGMPEWEEWGEVRPCEDPDCLCREDAS